MSETGFLKAHRLSLKKDFELVFSEGNSVNEFPFRFIWIPVNDNKNEVRYAISVSKKRFSSAVDRNTIKRRVREAFRKTYMSYVKNLELTSSYYIVIVYTHTSIVLQDEIQNKIENSLKKIIVNAKNF